MLPLPATLALVAGVTAAVPMDRQGRESRWRAGEAVLRLDVPLQLEPVAVGVSVAPSEGRDTTAPPCVADYCQSRVDVPGFQASFGKAHKSELFVALLDRAHIEPLASIAWFFVVSGLRVDWSPANLDPSFGAGAGGWGNVFVRLRLRIDAWNRPAVPIRPRDRMRQARELQAERAREQLRRELGGAQRPARLSST
ncbi:MAG TPA: hypothetical protein VF912_04205 [Anaeromyxobacter sp.]